MSGHYILRNIITTDLNHALGTIANADWSQLQHANVGWNTASRQVLNNALSNVAIGNRNGLPPHRYLQIPVQNPLPPAIRTFLQTVSWADQLVRPNSAGLGLRALSANAQAQFNAGNISESLIEQVQAGNVSIEVYYQDGLEMS